MYSNIYIRFYIYIGLNLKYINTQRVSISMKFNPICIYWVCVSVYGNKIYIH